MPGKRFTVMDDAQAIETLREAILAAYGADLDAGFRDAEVVKAERDAALSVVEALVAELREEREGYKRDYLAASERVVAAERERDEAKRETDGAYRVGAENIIRLERERDEWKNRWQKPRNHAPWCTYAHEGPCPAENEPPPDHPVWKRAEAAEAEREELRNAALAYLENKNPWTYADLEAALARSETPLAALKSEETQLAARPLGADVRQERLIELRAAEAERDALLAGIDEALSCNRGNAAATASDIREILRATLRARAALARSETPRKEDHEQDKRGADPQDA